MAMVWALYTCLPSGCLPYLQNQGVFKASALTKKDLGLITHQSTKSVCMET